MNPALTRLRESIKTQEATLVKAYQQAQLGPEGFLRARRKLVDATLRELAQHCALSSDYALCAVGGYGRGELFPHSDIDILLLLPDTTATNQAIEYFVQALWDLGWHIGCSVRSLSECLQAAQEDLSTETSLLEYRFLWGNRPLADRLYQHFRQQHDPARFFLAKQQEWQRRHAKHQDTPYALEPNVKTSPGTLRDLQTLHWLALSCHIRPHWKSMVRAGLMTDKEAAILQKVAHDLKRCRIEVQLIHRKNDDRLLFDIQPQLAQAYHYPTPTGKRASEAFMQHFYGAAGLVTLISRFVWQNFQARLFPQQNPSIVPIDADFQAVGNQLDIRSEDAFARNPNLLLKAFVLLAQSPTLQQFTVRTQRALWSERKRIDTQFRNNPVNQRSFIQIMRQRQGALKAIQAMSALKILSRYLPPWQKIVGQMQHDLVHIYTVDQHTLAVLQYLHQFGLPENAQAEPLLHQLIHECAQPHLLYIAALFHDIAKGRGGDHSQLGAQDVAHFARQHHLNDSDTELLIFLVEHHLSLSHYAQKRDLSDPQVIKDFAHIVKTPGRLRALYLLTVADMRGTNPRIWNPWKAQLLYQLYQSTREQLDTNESNTVSIVDRRRQQALRKVEQAGLSVSACQTWWAQLDQAYFARHNADDLAWHALCLAQSPLETKPQLHARPYGSGDNLQILVSAPDRPQLFEQLAGFFYAQHINVLDARIHTLANARALDSFIVQTQSLSPANIQALLNALAQWLAKPTPTRLPDQQRSVGAHTRRLRTFPILPSVQIRQNDYGDTWVLTLVTTDSPGILYHVARVLNQHHISLQMAKIMTVGDKVEDIFVITSPTLRQAGQIETLTQSLCTLLHQLLHVSP